MASEGGEQGTGGEGEKAVLSVRERAREPEKILISFEHQVRIKAEDFVAIKKSFEEWADQWR